MGNGLDCKSYHHCDQPHPPLDPSGSHDFNITVEYYGSNVTVEWQHNGKQIKCTEPICNRMDISDGLLHKTVQCLILILCVSTLFMDVHDSHTKTILITIG